MTERTIFLQALERESGAARTAFLAKACGADAGLRQRVEQLLHSHSEAGGFLGQPVLGVSATGDATPGGETETHSPDAHGGEVALDFLSPSNKPGSLGRLDHYEVIDIVGRGGMGIVLRAFDEKLHRVVALKVMTRDIAGSAAARKRFSREAKAAAAVVHDHIVPIHAIEESGPTPYLVMQFIEGQSLQQKIDAEGSLELKEILRIGLQIASGLAAAQKQGLVHRDIKPSNILLENGVQRVKITDFGLARAVDDSSVSQSGIVAGTPQYMSPEQADGQPVDHRSDLFSLGSVLYAMCTGRPPFRASSTVATLKRVCEDTPRPIRELNPDMPEWLGEIIAKLHAKKPAERFQSATEVAEELEGKLAHTQQHTQVELPKPATSSPALARVNDPAAKKAAWLLRLLLGTLAIGGFVQGVLWIGWASRGQLFAWAAGASAVAMVGLALFFGYHLIKVWRAHPSLRAGSSADRGRVRSAIGWAALTLPILAIVIVNAELVPKIKRLFYHELVLRIPDRVTDVQFWRTNDDATEVSRWSHTGHLPLPPSELVPDPQGRLVRLIPPGKYWMQIYVGDTQVERRLLTIGWGGRQELVIGDPDAAVADSRLLQGEWEGMSVKYIGGPELGAEALTLTALQFDGEMLRLRLPGMDTGLNFKVFVGSDARLLLTGKSSSATFRLEGLIRYSVFENDLNLRIDCAQPRVRDSSYKGVGLPIPVPANQGLAIVLRRKHATSPGDEQRDSTRSGGQDMAELQRLVTLQEKAVEVAKSRVQAGAAAVGEVTAAEIDLLEAKTKLAQAQRRPADVERFLTESIGKREEQWNQAKKRHGAGQGTTAEVDQAEQQVVEARLRLRHLDDKARLQGAWIAVSGEREGRALTTEQLQGMKIKFQEGRIRVEMPGRVFHEANFKLDQTTVPKEIDVIGTRDQKGRYGIYRFDGETLSICMGEDNERPSEFRSLPVFPTRLALVFHRANPIDSSANLNGHWIAASAEYQGRAVPESEAKTLFPTEISIKGNQYGITWDGKRHEGTLTIDASKNPAEMDFSGSAVKPRKAIYKLDGNRLTICMPLVGPNADPPRPTEFKSDPRSKNSVQTFRRGE